MRKGIKFDVGTTDFKHAVDVLEIAFGYEGTEWEVVKNSNSMEELILFLECDGLDFSVFNLKD